MPSRLGFRGGINISNTSNPTLSRDVTKIDVAGRQFWLIGTAHVSKESADLAKDSIRELRPDVVCLELDLRRYDALREERGFGALNLREVIKKRQLTTLILNLLLSSYQRRIGLTLGTLPGAEFIAAATTAEVMKIPLVLCDRDIQITFHRAWRTLTVREKFGLLSELLQSCFVSSDLTESDLRDLRSQNTMTQMMNDFSSHFPTLKRILIDERDLFLAEKIYQSVGNRVVSIVGAGHIEGIKRALKSPIRADLEELNQIPHKRCWLKILGWAVPAVVILGLSMIGLQKGAADLQENLLFWIMINGIPSAICTALAMGNPVTILSALVFAPFTSLTPIIGIGYVTAFVQAYVRPPRVDELDSSINDATNIKGWFKNKLLRILLVFIFSTLGSIFGTWTGGAKILGSIY